MKTPEYRRGYLAGYKAAKTGSTPTITTIEASILHKVIDLIEAHQIPVGNSAYGEAWAEGAISATRDLRDQVRKMIYQKPSAHEPDAAISGQGG